MKTQEQIELEVMMLKDLLDLLDDKEHSADYKSYVAGKLAALEWVLRPYRK